MKSYNIGSNGNVRTGARTVHEVSCTFAPHLSLLCSSHWIQPLHKQINYLRISQARVRLASVRVWCGPSTTTQEITGAIQSSLIRKLLTLPITHSFEDSPFLNSSSFLLLKLYGNLLERLSSVALSTGWVTWSIILEAIRWISPWSLPITMVIYTYESVHLSLWD